MNYTDQYLEKQLIGRGHYGRAYLVYHRQSGLPFVAKKIQFSGMTQQQQQSSLKQVNIHKKLKHNNILSFKEYFLQNQVLIMIIEYCEFGDLSVYIKNRKQKGQYFDEPLIINWFVQMLFGLNYLHQNKVLHRDIKTQNIFIDSEGTIKLADFGISKMLQHTSHLATTMVGTPYYLSPQACNNKGYSLKSDIWSLGCVLYELCTLQHPFQGDNILLLAKKISSEQPKSISSSYSQDLSKLVKLLLKKVPEQRPSLRQILQTKFIADYLVKFKMHDINHKQKYAIFQTECLLQNQNQFLDLEYSQGSVHKVEHPSKIQKPKNNVDQIKISPKKSGTQNLRKKCIQKLGSDAFYQIYDFMKSLKKKKINQASIQQSLRDKYTKKQFQSSMDIAQLIYLEETQNY